MHILIWLRILNIYAVVIDLNLLTLTLILINIRTPARIWSLIGHLVTLNLGISGTKYQ